MTVTEAKELFERLETYGYGDYNIAVNNIKPHPYNLTIGRFTWNEVEDREYEKRCKDEVERVNKRLERVKEIIRKGVETMLTDEYEPRPMLINEVKP